MFIKIMKYTGLETWNKANTIKMSALIGRVNKIKIQD